jgi:hypothetical protein
MVNAKFLSLLPEFKRRFFHNYGKTMIPYALQRKDQETGQVDYHWYKTGTVTDQLLFQHFSQKPVRASKQYEVASLAIPGDWEVVKWVCIDFDTETQILAGNNILLPHLKKDGIEGLVGTSREGRFHYWFLCNLTLETAERYLLQVFNECRLNYREYEVYPLFTRRKAPIRMEGGYHFKAGKASPVVVNGQEGSTPEFVLEAFNSLPIYNEHEIKPKIKESKVSFTPEKTKKVVDRTPFKYIPLNLPCKVEGLPPYADSVVSNCQAYNTLLNAVVEEGMIDKQGIDHHNAGLAIAGLFRYNDYRLKHDEGEKVFNELKEKFRSRDDWSHHWNTRNTNPTKVAWRCETLENYFGLCHGCPWKKRDNFDNPKQLYYGRRVGGIIKKIVPSISNWRHDA